MTHKTETVNIDGKDVEIDSDIAPLIRELNKAGLKTKYSCRGGDDFDPLKRAYIAFDMTNFWMDFAEHFVTIRWVLKEKNK